MTNLHAQGSPEPYRSIKEAAAELGIHPRMLSRAIHDGIVPAYRPFRRRRIFVIVSEVVAAISSGKIGGGA